MPQMKCFQLSANYQSLLPSDLDGLLQHAPAGAPPWPPSGSPNYFLNLGSDSKSLNLWKFHVDFGNLDNSTLTGPINIPVANFTEACGGGICIPQAGTKGLLDSLGDRLMYRLAYRNLGDHEALVVNHSVATGTTWSNVGVRWYEVRNPNGATLANATDVTPPVVFQQGSFAPDAKFRWMGSVAMDKFGDMAVGYSVSSSSIHPSIGVTGRVPKDTPGTLKDPLGTLEAEILLSLPLPGGSQLKVSNWGDYSSMSVDPVDDCTFWFTTEYLQTDGNFNWRTRIVPFKFPSCL